MKAGYSWETEEEEVWAGEEPPAVSTPSPRGKRRMFLLLLGLTVAVFLLLFVLFERRLQAREELVRENVLAAHRTWEQAVGRRDLELFTSLLARDDVDWFLSQRRLLMSGRSLDRTPLGLTLESDRDETATVELDANWRRAEVSFPRPYTPAGGAGNITLTHTQFYQLRGSRWQTSRPPASFWGETQTRETGRLAVTYPERDEALVARLAEDLARDIDALCAAEGASTGECDPARRIPLRFDTDPESLLALGDTVTPVMRGREFLLPAPSLVGLPVDDSGYRAIYHGYTDRVLSALRNSIALPIPLPEQDVALLCFPSLEEGLNLYTYNPTEDTWTLQESDRRFSTLRPLPDDSGLILRAGFPGVEMARLELVLRRAGEEAALFNEGTTELSARLVDIPRRPQVESLLLSDVQGSTGLTSYRLLTLDRCAAGACEVTELAGFPVWSPDGGRSLVLTGPELSLGDADGVPVRAIGRAFSPFWLTDDTFGYVRLLGNATDELPEMELVLQSATTGETRPLIKSADLLRQLDTDLAGTLRIMHVTADPTEPRRLFLAGTPVAGGGERFYVLKLELGGDVAALSADTRLERVETVMALDDLPVGDGSTLTPTGYRPFAVTPDGRRLVVVRFVDPVTNTWALALHDIAGGQTQTLTLNYPAYPAPFPFYDWSADGNWLLLVDNGFLRLIAPDHDYERVVTHEFSACRYPGWINR